MARPRLEQNHLKYCVPINVQQIRMFQPFWSQYDYIMLETMYNKQSRSTITVHTEQKYFRNTCTLSLSRQIL